MLEIKIEKYYKRDDDKSSLTGRYYIKTIERNKVIAHFDILDINWICRIASIEFAIDDEKLIADNQNYVHNLINAMVHHIYNELNLLKIKTKIYSNQDILIKNLQDFGFEIEGFLKNELYLNGEFYDCVYLAYFRSNYNENIIKTNYQIENNVEINEEDILADKEISYSLKKIGSAFKININKNNKE